MVLLGDLNQDIITLKPTYGANEVNVFQDVKTCVIIQLQYWNAPCMIDVHCMKMHFFKPKSFQLCYNLIFIKIPCDYK
jgi:hypothetical protein